MFDENIVCVDKFADWYRLFAIEAIVAFNYDRHWPHE